MPPLLQSCDPTDPRIACRHRAAAEAAGTFWPTAGGWLWLRETRISEWATCPWCAGALPSGVPTQGDGFVGEEGG